MDKREIWRFLAVTFVLGIAAQVLAIRDGVAGDGRMWLKAAMWTPAIGAMTSRSARKAAFASLRRSGGKWLGFSLVIGWALLLIQTVLLFAFGGGDWNDKLFPLDPHGGGILAVHHVAMALGVGAQGFGFFALNLVLSLTLARSWADCSGAWEKNWAGARSCSLR